MVRAVVLAAGASSRMGRPKAALPLTDRADTFLLRVIRTLRAAGLADIVVVTGATPEAVRAAAGPADRRVRFVHNPDWPSGQLSSVLAGLDGAGRDNLGLEALLVTLVDVPLVRADTVARVLEAWRSTRAPIVRPARGAVHGHPVVFDRLLFDELRAAAPETGAKTVVRAHEHDVVNVPIEDEGAFADIDTIDEYRAAIREKTAAPTRRGA